MSERIDPSYIEIPDEPFSIEEPVKKDFEVRLLTNAVLLMTVVFFLLLVTLR